jgi:hypothetical protein
MDYKGENMKVDKIFKFKSREPFYTKERAGIKNNTVREIDLNEDRFLELIHSMIEGFNDGDLKIEIQCDGFNFIRDITDISIWNNLMIITWRHDGRK